MAAITVEAPLEYPVFGNMRAIVAQIDIATTGDTYATPFTVIHFVTTSNPGLVTNVAVSGGTLTFTIGGAVTNAKLLVIGV